MKYNFAWSIRTLKKYWLFMRNSNSAEQPVFLFIKSGNPGPSELSRKLLMSYYLVKLNTMTWKFHSTQRICPTGILVHELQDIRTRMSIVAKN